MKSTPLLHSPRQINIELFKFFLLQLLVELNNSLNALLLSLASSVMEGTPIIVIFAIWVATIHDEGLSDVGTLLGVLGENIHYEVQRSASITINSVYINAQTWLVNECSDNGDLKFNDS